jgi:hypothetical protein
MSKNEATLLDSQTGKVLAEINLEGPPIHAEEVISDSGSIQGFFILSGYEGLMDIWFDQKAILLRQGNVQQLVKIATFPTEKENKGHLDFIPGTKEFCAVEEESPLKTRAKRGLAVIQTLLGS